MSFVVCGEAADEIERLQVEYDHAVEQAAKNADEVLALREQLALAETVRAAQVAGLTEGAQKLREHLTNLVTIRDQMDRSYSLTKALTKEEADGFVTLTIQMIDAWDAARAALKGASHE
jgi:hypothetical protein